jgi:tetratricopeptide (TPR) repeat protein
MLRWTFAWFLIAATLVARGGVTNGPAVTSIAPVDLPALIHNLADADPAIRSVAVDRLQSLGESVRPALLDALDSPDPQIRAQAAVVLLHLPWSRPTDPADIRQKLANYGSLIAENRCDLVVELANLPDNAAVDALLRILRDDPSATVRWTAADELRAARDGFQPPMDRLRALLTETKEPAEQRAMWNNAPLLAAAGWAWREVDLNRADELLLRAVTLDAQHPAAMQGQIDFAYLWLIERATAAQHYVDALNLLRQQAARTAWDADNLPAPVAALFALHAEHGPFAGWVDDLRLYRGYLDRPEMLYVLARLAQRRAPPGISVAFNTIAFLSGGASEQRHYAVGCFLADQGWLAPAQRELRAALWLSRGNSVNIYFQLARVAAERNDDGSVARNLESALRQIPESDQTMRRTTRFGDEVAWSSADAWAEVHWHYLRAARAAHDLPAVQLHLEKLMELDKLGQILHKDPGLATDIVPALDDTGRHDDAAKCFDAAYQDLHATIAAHPDSAEAKNNLAWLCARCGRKLDEAVKWANEAMAAAPANAAYLDTAAEANFRNGNPAEAVRLESQALRLKPNDVFMTGQLRRFRDAARDQKSK